MKWLMVLIAITFAGCAPVTNGPPASDMESSPTVSPEVDSIVLAAEPLGEGRYRLILRNRDDGPIGYNLCSSDLQRWTGSSWEDIPTGEFCTAEIRTLAPGRDATFEKILPEKVAPGTYRYVTRVEVPLSAPMRSVATAGFTVR